LAPPVAPRSTCRAPVDDLQMSPLGSSRGFSGKGKGKSPERTEKEIWDVDDPFGISVWIWIRYLRARMGRPKKG
jgi:hypothetical protein